MVGVAIHHQLIAIVTIVVVGVPVVEFPNVLNIEVVLRELCSTRIIFTWLQICLTSSHFSVVVTGLPQSASWQDLKVLYFPDYL